MLRHFGAVAIVASAAITPSTARACSCHRPVSPIAAAESSEAVFVGEVVKIDVNERGAYVVEFLVPTPNDPGERRLVFRGDLPERVVVTTNRQSSMCGYRFDLGSVYLVYAFKSPADGGWATGTCSHNALLRRKDGATDPEVLQTLAQLAEAFPERARAAEEETTTETAAPTKDTATTETGQPGSDPPRRNGCAGCHTTGGSGGFALMGMVIALLWIRRSSAIRLRRS